MFESLFNKAVERLQHVCFSVNNGKSLRTPTLKNVDERLLLFFAKKIVIPTLFGFYQDSTELRNRSIHSYSKKCYSRTFLKNPRKMQQLYKNCIPSWVSCRKFLENLFLLTPFRSVFRTLSNI